VFTAFEGTDLLYENSDRVLQHLNWERCSHIFCVTGLPIRIFADLLAVIQTLAATSRENITDSVLKNQVDE
jgi:hypothetical protein